MTTLALAGNAPRLSSAQYAAQSFGVMFCFGMPTFANTQLGDGTENPSLFNPSGFNPGQWLDAAKAAGATYVVPVFKHPDGFCLWNSTAQPHNISLSPSPWSGRDLLREFYVAARQRGLFVVPYISIWDRRWESDHPGFSNAQYLQFSKDIMTEVQARCPNAAGVWTDAWGWQVGYTVVNYASLRAHITSLWPKGLLVENNHEHTLTHTDIDVWEVDVDDLTSPSAVPAERVDTILDTGGGEYNYFWISNSAISKTAATLHTRKTTYNARNAAYLLNCPPRSDGVLHSDVTGVLAAI